MSRILVVDDEASVLGSFERILVKQGYAVSTAGSAEAALAIVASEPPDLIVMDIHLPGMGGLEAFQRIRTQHPRLPVVIMTGFGTTESAIEATRLGAFDYQLKPFDPGQMLRLIERALESTRLMQREVRIDANGAADSGDAIVGQSPSMQEVYKAIGRVAETDATVLIRGETGTGKELVARAIYQHSRRRQAPLVIVNCAAIPETLLESELFGHEKGAFTGATARRVGKFEQADGGTILLDEIGDLSLSTQAKLLRVLQAQAFERIGGSETIRPDVRVLAATNRDLEESIATGRFRGDLYHRLDVVTIRVPPLRQRREDITQLAAYFLHRLARQYHTDPQPLADEALAILCAHPWPGNVRELEHCLERAAIFTQGRPIQSEDIVQAMEQPSRAGSLAGPEVAALRECVQRYLQFRSGEAVHQQLVDTVDELLVTEALRLSAGNQSQAARMLGLSRPTLRAKMHKHGALRADDGADDGAGGG